MMVVGITNGTIHAPFEQINIVDGDVQEANFNSYRVICVSEALDIEVSLVPTPGGPIVGMGRVGLPPIGPAIANAVARFTGGVRLRHYPLLPERVLALTSHSRHRLRALFGQAIVIEGRLPRSDPPALKPDPA